jgi:hypothetical protein
MQPHCILAIALQMPLLVYRGFFSLRRLLFLRFQVLHCASFLLVLAAGGGGARELARACVPAKYSLMKGACL